MTDEQIAAWKTERSIARGIKDPEERRIALEKVYDHRDEMQMTCIAHQSGRVKELLSRSEANTDGLKELNDRIVPLEAMKKEYEKLKERSIGAKWGFRIALILVGKFGWDAISSLFSSFGS